MTNTSFALMKMETRPTRGKLPVIRENMAIMREDNFDPETHSIFFLSLSGTPLSLFLCSNLSDLTLGYRSRLSIPFDNSNDAAYEKRKHSYRYFANDLFFSKLIIINLNQTNIDILNKCQGYILLIKYFNYREHMK